MIPVSFIDYASSFWMERHIAEIYMRLYQYAAQDFRAVTDCTMAHQRVALWMQMTNNSIQSTVSQISSHTHMSPDGGTSPPLSPIMFIQNTPAPPPLSTTMMPENIAGNVAIPSVTLSYIDLSLTGINTPTFSFRRGLQIPIAYGPVSMAIKLQ